MLTKRNQASLLDRLRSHSSWRFREVIAMGAKRYRVLWLMVGAFFVALAVLAPSMIYDPCRSAASVKASAFQKLVLGMSEREVVTIVGGPSGDYATRPVGFYCYHRVGHRPADRGTPMRWYFDSECVTVWFQDGKMQLVEFGSGFPEPTWFEKVLRRWEPGRS